MSDNLIQEYIARVNKLKDMANIEEGDFNAFLELHPRIEKHVFEMGMILDLIESQKEETFLDSCTEKTYPRMSSKMFERLKRKVLGKGGETSEES